jgi:hypothetical protein
MTSAARWRAFCASVLVAAIAMPAQALEPGCNAPARIAPSPELTKRIALARVRDYTVILSRCENSSRQLGLAIRRMIVDGRPILLMVDPASLVTTRLKRRRGRRGS